MWKFPIVVLAAPLLLIMRMTCRIESIMPSAHAFGANNNRLRLPTRRRRSTTRVLPRSFAQSTFLSASNNSSNNNNNKNNNRNTEKVVLDQGFNLLGIASKFVPQGRIVQTAKDSWKFLWQRFMVELAPQDPSGTYQRPTYTFSSSSSSSSTLGSTQHPLEGNGRYHVYVGNPCPWCHRVRLVVNILGLEEGCRRLGMTQLVDDPVKASRGGWVFANPPPQAPQVNDLRELYQFCHPWYKGRCTAPVLVDWKTRTIVSNESKDIVRMLPLLLVSVEPGGSSTMDLCPAHLQSKIDETNAWIYQLVNNGCYQCGFATTQTAYDRASANVLQGMDRCEAILKVQPFLCGDTFTESDIFLLPTMLRFDAVYAPLFGAGGSRHWRLQCDFPFIFQWMKRCWKDIPGVSSSIDLQDASRSYYQQLFPLNPGGIIPSTPMTAQRLGLEE